LSRAPFKRYKDDTLKYHLFSFICTKNKHFDNFDNVSMTQKVSFLLLNIN